MDQRQRPRNTANVLFNASDLVSVSSSGCATAWTATRNRQKVLGFAAAAVSMILIAAPFLLNVDSDVSAKAQTISTVAGSAVPEIVNADDVIRVLNSARLDSLGVDMSEDSFLSSGAQNWAATVAADGNIRHDPSLRNLLDQRELVGEFVVGAPTLALAYERLTANSVQHRELMAAETSTVGVGVQTNGAKTYLVVRFSSSTTP